MCSFKPSLVEHRLNAAGLSWVLVMITPFRHDPLECVYIYMAVGQNQWYHFGVGAPPILVYVSGDWGVHWGYGLLIIFF